MNTQDNAEFKVHWPSAHKNALGQAQPACKARGGFHQRPVLTMSAGEVTCVKCKRWSEVRK